MNAQKLNKFRALKLMIAMKIDAQFWYPRKNDEQYALELFGENHKKQFKILETH